MSSETLFDVARVTLAQLRVVQQGSSHNGLLSVTSDAVRAAEEDMAQLGEVQEICASLEEKLTLYDYPEGSITVMSSQDDNFLKSSSDNRESNIAAQQREEEKFQVCCTSTSPLLRTLAWLAHTQRPNTTTATIPISSTSNVTAQVEATNTTISPEVSYTLDTECRALWSFPDTVANAIFASTSTITSSSSKINDNNPLVLVQQDTSRGQSTQPSLDTLRGFSFSSELYYNRLADALWVFALTTPKRIVNEESAVDEQGECYQVKDGRAVVYAMLRSGVARGFSHVLQQRLTLALRSIQCSISHDSTRYEKACVMNILLGIMAGAGQSSRTAGFHLQHKLHTGQDMNIHALTRHWRLSSSWIEWLRYFCTLTMKSKSLGVGQKSWTRVIYDVLFELLHGNAACTAARALCTVRTCNTEEDEVDVVAPTSATLSTLDIEAQSAAEELLLAQRLCYGIGVELTTRQATPRPLLRFIFTDLLHTTSTLSSSPVANDAGGNTTTNTTTTTSMSSSECIAEAAMQAVFEAWGSAVCVQKGDLALNETLQHAVLYAMRWLVAHKPNNTNTNEEEKAKQEGQDAVLKEQQRSSHFPSKWLGALLSGITRRLESVRTEPLRRAGLCVAAGFALYFVDAAETVQNLLQDPQYASALTDWLAEEEETEEEEENEFKGGASEALRLKRGGRKDIKTLTSTSTTLRTNTAGGGMSRVNGVGLPVRRVVAYGLVQRYPLDPDEPVAYFVSEQQQEDEQEGDGHLGGIVSKQITTGAAADAIGEGIGEVAYLRQHTATLTTTSSTPSSNTVVHGSSHVARVQDLPSFGLRRLPGERPTVTNYVDPTTHSTNNTVKEEGKVKSEAVDDEDAILYMSDSPQTPAPRSLRGSYELLAGIGRNAQAQLYEVQSDQEKGLRGLLWCLRRHLRLTQQRAAAARRSTQRSVTSTSSSATVRATSDSESSPSLLLTLNELGPMLPSLLPVLMGLAFHAPEAERALLLQYGNEALELIIVATPTLALAQLAKMIYNTRYGIYERVAMIDAIGHAAHRLATLRSTVKSGNTSESNAARVVPRRIYPPIGPTTTTTTSSNPTNSTTLSNGVGNTGSSATTTRRAIVVNEGRRGQTRRWGYAVPGRANSLSSQPLLFCNAFGPYALTFCAVLIARVDKEEHYQFFQLDDPYTPAAVLRALWYVLDGVRLVRHIAPQLCSEVMQFVSIVALQHPHEAIKQLAWISCGEVMRCWCGAVPLYSPKQSTTTTTTTPNSDSDGGLQRTPISEAYKGYDGSRSLMFSEEWLRAFASLERCAATLLNNNTSSTSNSSSESTCEMALVVMCDLRELVEGTREAAWMAEHSATHTIEIV